RSERGDAVGQRHPDAAVAERRERGAVEVHDVVLAVVVHVREQAGAQVPALRGGPHGRGRESGAGGQRHPGGSGPGQVHRVVTLVAVDVGGRARVGGRAHRGTPGLRREVVTGGILVGQ